MEPTTAPQPKKKRNTSTLLEEVKEWLEERFIFRHNVLTNETEYTEIETGIKFILDDEQLDCMLYDITVDGVSKVGIRHLQIVINKFKYRYNPLHSYFEGLKWDGVSNIERLAQTMVCDDIKTERESNVLILKNVYAEYFKKWLVGAAAQAMGLGQNHIALILAGAQGKGKTTWLNNLCPKELADFLFTGHINPSIADNNTANLIAEKFLVNIDDQLDDIKKMDLDEIKSLITAKDVTNRKAYARTAPKRPRICSFVGSVNNPRFLTDTENRRYLVIPIVDINYNHDIEIQQVWAEAIALLKSGYRYWLDAAEIADFNSFNESFRALTIEEELLSLYYKSPEVGDNPADIVKYTNTEILLRLQKRSGYNNLRNRVLGKALEKRFGKPRSCRVNGAPRYVFELVEVSDIDKEVKPMHLDGTLNTDTDDDDLPF